MNQSEVKVKESVEVEGGAGSFNWLHILPLILCAMGVLVYANTMGVPFVLDDAPSVEKFVGASFGEFWDYFKTATRPVADITMYANALISGEEPWSYHVFNTAVHICASLILFGIIRRVLETGRVGERLKNGAVWYAFAVAAIWLVHPLQTQAVTYVIQRHESMMGMFYLLVFYSLVRLATCEDAKQRRWWIVVGIVASCLGMGSKQVMVTAPVVALLFDRCFLADSWRDVIKQRGVFYLGLMASWGVIAWLLYVEAVYGDTSAGFDTQLLTPVQYLFSQGEAIVSYYLKLCYWPTNQVLDYHSGLIPAFLRKDDPTWWITCGVVGVLLLVSFYGMARLRWWGFCGMWFFLILGPSSSIMPIADVVFEHRMYLSLAGVVCLTVFGLDWVLVKVLSNASVRRMFQAMVLLVVVSVLMCLTVVRNDEYGSLISIWTTVVERVPYNARGWHNLGSAYDQAGESELALQCFDQVLEIVPHHAETLNSVGKIRMDKGYVGEAAALFKRAIDENDRNEIYHYNYGRALWATGDLDGAIRELERAVALKPKYPSAYNNLGLVYLQAGRDSEGVKAFKKAIDIRPNFADAYYNLGIFNLKQNQPHSAVDRFESALKIEPDRVDVMNGLGQGYAMLGRLADAWDVLVKANRLDPSYVPVVGNMAVVSVSYAKAGDVDMAVKRLREVIALAQRGGMPPQLIAQFKAQLEAFTRPVQ